MLGEKGFRSFPSLAFLDAEGNVIGKPGNRTVASFDQTLGLLSAHSKLALRIKAGEKGLEFDLLMAEFELGKITGKAAIRRANGLKNLNDAQKKRLAQFVVDVEVADLAKRAYKNNDTLPEVSKRLEELLKAGTLPSNNVLYDFWNILAYTSERDGNAELLGRCVEGFRSIEPKRPEFEEKAVYYEEKYKALTK